MGLPRLHFEIFQCIKYDNPKRLVDLAADANSDINFMIEIASNVSYNPLILAAVLGHAECVKVLLSNPNCKINMKNPHNGCNAFWFACYYGRGECISLLAEAGIDILNVHRPSLANALHIAAKMKHEGVIQMLSESDFPLDDNMVGGITALMICADDVQMF